MDFARHTPEGWMAAVGRWPTHEVVDLTRDLAWMFWLLFQVRQCLRPLDLASIVLASASVVFFVVTLALKSEVDALFWGGGAALALLAVVVAAEHAWRRFRRV